LAFELELEKLQLAPLALELQLSKFQPELQASRPKLLKHWR
jgi:hypothetical protein